MSTYRHALKRARTGRILDQQLGAPLPRIRPGQEIDATAGQLFEVVVDSDVIPGGVIPVGRVRADGTGALRVDPALRSVNGLPVVVRESEAGDLVGADAVDGTLRTVAADYGRGDVPGHPGCERLP